MRMVEADGSVSGGAGGDAEREAMRCEREPPEQIANKDSKERGRRRAVEQLSVGKGDGSKWHQGDARRNSCLRLRHAAVLRPAA